MDVIKVLAATLKTASFNKFDLAWRSFGWAHGGGRAGGGGGGGGGGRGRRKERI